jgi:hypothetical protein
LNAAHFSQSDKIHRDYFLLIYLAFEISRAATSPKEATSHSYRQLGLIFFDKQALRIKFSDMTSKTYG